jgi:hypothetical protein
MHLYREETGIVDLDLDVVLIWAEAKGLVTKPTVDPWQKLKRDMAVAAREEYITDDNGNPVRRNHAYTIKQGERQHLFWGCIEDMTPQKWRNSMQHRRRSGRSDFVRLEFQPGR